MGPTNFGGAPAFGDALFFSGTLGLGSPLAFGADFAKAIFDEAEPEPLGATGAFGAITFQPDTFTRFLAGPASVPTSRFLAAFLLASEPGSKQGHRARRPVQTLTAATTMHRSCSLRAYLMFGTTTMHTSPQCIHHAWHHRNAYIMLPTSIPPDNIHCSLFHLHQKAIICLLRKSGNGEIRRR
jgi:hypothetical protein